MEPLFPLGQTVSTRNAINTVHPEDMRDAMSRHASGDWGDVDADDRKANDDALKHGARLLSVYHDRNSVKFYIITEHDRSVTTVLLPEDY